MSRQRLVPAYLVGETSRVVVFACGDPRQADDSVAARACRSLPAEALARADIKLIGELKPEYLRDLPPGVSVVIADGMPGARPGEIVELALVAMSGREAPLPTTSARAQSVDEVVAIAQLLRDEPVIGRFVGVGIEVRTDGEPHPAVPQESIELLSRAVARAIIELDAWSDTPDAS
jgi:Ni,Fe-hydrogenase maturation factor